MNKNDYEVVKREYREWVRLWWENADNTSKSRVLLVGDSITAGYRPFLQEAFSNSICVDQLASSRSITDPLHTRELKYMLNINEYKVIHFNNGLHGWHLSIEEYKKGLCKAIDVMKELQPGAHIILASSTPVSQKGQVKTLNMERDTVLTERNKVVSQVSEKYRIAINDLYGFTLDKPELKSEDGVHFIEKGYRLLSGQVFSAIKSEEL